jgi:tetratricopeptide (TPR) repeat protein
MTRLTHPLPVKATVASHFIGRCATRFSPEEIRQAIAELVAHNQLDMASALCDAGLSLYPNSEDILSISALLAELEQDWATAQLHLEKLLELQGTQTRATVWHHLIRVVRCQLDIRKSLELAQQAIGLHPSDDMLQEELHALQEEATESVLPLSTELAH